MKQQEQQAHPEIPTGMYCYTRENGKFKICPHWHKTDKGARCDLLNEEHHTCCPFHLVWDQVKECGINDKDSWEVLEIDLDEPSEPEPSKGVKKTVTCPCNRKIEITDVKGDEDKPCKLDEVFRQIREGE